MDCSIALQPPSLAEATDGGLMHCYNNLHGIYSSSIIRIQSILAVF